MVFFLPHIAAVWSLITLLFITVFGTQFRKPRNHHSKYRKRDLNFLS